MTNFIGCATLIFCFCGGDLVSTWALKQEEHTGAYEDLDKNVQTCII